MEATKRKDPAAALRSILRQLEEKRDEWLVAANLCVTTGLMDERASHRAIVYKENADVLTSLIAKYVAADSPEAKLWGERTVCFNCGHDKKFKYVPLCEDCFQELDETK